MRKPAMMRPASSCFKMTLALESEVSLMCNLSKGVEERVRESLNRI